MSSDRPSPDLISIFAFVCRFHSVGTFHLVSIIKAPWSTCIIYVQLLHVIAYSTWPSTGSDFVFLNHITQARWVKITLGCLRNFSSGLPPLRVKVLLTGSKVQLEFSLPFAFDNIYAQDGFYRAIHTERLDISTWMLERQNLDNGNTLHLAVMYKLKG